MIIEYDTEDRCIRVDGEFITFGDVEAMRDALELAIDAWEVDHATTDNPDGHYDD